MKPIDYRNETYQDLLGRISGQREQVLQAWRQHGPCSTEELAEKSGISILNVRPRTTELYQLGFVIFEGKGVYRAAGTEEIKEKFSQLKRAATTGQAELSL